MLEMILEMHQRIIFIAFSTYNVLLISFHLVIKKWDMFPQQILSSGFESRLKKLGIFSSLRQPPAGQGPLTIKLGTSSQITKSKNNAYSLLSLLVLPL